MSCVWKFIAPIPAFLGVYYRCVQQFNLARAKPVILAKKNLGCKFAVLGTKAASNAPLCVTGLSEDILQRPLRGLRLEANRIWRVHRRASGLPTRQATASPP